MLPFGTKFLIARIDRALEQGKIPAGILRRWIDHDPEAAEYLRNMIELEDRLATDQFSYLNLDPLNPEAWNRDFASANSLFADPDHKEELDSGKNRDLSLSNQERIGIEKNRKTARSRWLFLAGAVVILLAVGIGFFFYSKTDQIVRNQDPVYISNGSRTVQAPAPVLTPSPAPAPNRSLSEEPQRDPIFAGSDVSPVDRSLNFEEWMESYPVFLVSPEISAFFLKPLPDPNSDSPSLSSPEQVPSAAKEKPILAASDQNDLRENTNSQPVSGENAVAADVSNKEKDPGKEPKVPQEDLFHEIMNSNPFSAHLMEYYISPVFAAQENL
ncbi:MAG: hypothetical protein Q4G69_02040 [Planctomycetia bacterium]|nr:hypothetical protein [Planctomycetia bacterium]